MDFAIRRVGDHRDSTAYIEIGPGRYAGKHWQAGFLFVPEAAFGLVDGLVAVHLPAYDRFGINEVPRDVGLAIVRDWRAVSGRLSSLSLGGAEEALHLDPSLRLDLAQAAEVSLVPLTALLRELADQVEAFYRHTEWVSILGL